LQHYKLITKDLSREMDKGESAWGAVFDEARIFFAKNYLIDVIIYL